MGKPVRHGTKWRIRPLDEHGERESFVYDDYRDAAFKLRQREIEVEEIKRGLRTPIQADKRFDELCDYWVERRAPKKRSGKDDKSIIKCHLRPALGQLKIREVGTGQIDDMVDDRDHLEAKTVSNILTLLITMLNVAVELKWLQTAPKIRKPSVALFSTDYRYLRTEEEISRLLRAARNEVTGRRWMPRGSSGAGRDSADATSTADLG